MDHLQRLRRANLACFCGVLLLLPRAHAQVSDPHYRYSLAGEVLLANTLTTPVDDSVLDSAPRSLQITFPQLVRLVKLTLHNERHDWVDINFRYSPAFIDRFSLPLPALNTAAYYTADWAVLSGDDQLVRGSFSFAFGPEAEPPSQTRAGRELFVEGRNGNNDPNVRTVTPPPTRIIINREPRRYDPPFVIDLDNDDGMH